MLSNNSAIARLKDLYGPELLCLALVKPRCSLASKWQLSKPSYCILELSSAFGEVTLRWGDGSWQAITDADQLNDLIILDQFGEKDIADLFD